MNISLKTIFKIKFATFGALVRIIVLLFALTLLSLWAFYKMTNMPSKSYTGPLPQLNDTQIKLRDELHRDVNTLADQIGERNIWNYEKLNEAANFIEKSLTNSGYHVHRQNYDVQGKTCCNIEVQITGTAKPREIVIVGAHYDSVLGSVGANDNISGVAATLALARRFADKKTPRTLRFVLFVNEEPPFYRTEQMGSFVYAKSCKENKDNIVAMLALETIGYYSDEPKSQKYPFPFSLLYPSTGNFIGFVSNMGPSRKLLNTVVAAFRKKCKFPSQGAAIPQFITGTDWSDHWSFWQQGYPAIMVTDTALFRYPYYHTYDDTPDKIDYDRLARVVTGLQTVVAELTED